MCVLTHDTAPTGASRGIGHGTCQLFAAAGWRVITVSRTAFDTSSKCPWKAGTLNHVTADLSTPEGTSAAIAEIKRKLGGEPLHALVNNAAISPKNAVRFPSIHWTRLAAAKRPRSFCFCREASSRSCTVCFHIIGNVETMHD